MVQIIPTDELAFLVNDYTMLTRTRNEISRILDRQGLIEPLVLNSKMELIGAWDKEYLTTCIYEGWETVIVTWPGE